VLLAACDDPTATDKATLLEASLANVTSAASWLDLRPVTGFEDLVNPASLDFYTYDGSRQVVHPDVVRVPSSWNGSPWWAAITPYPGGDRNIENPSIYGSDDGVAWNAPPGATNPVVRTRRGHLSDPDVVFDPATNSLVLFYRETVLKSSRHSDDLIMRLTSTDGVTWKQPRQLLSSRGKYFVSPTVTIGPDRTWRMWAVDAGTTGCSATTTRVIQLTSKSGTKFGNARIIPLQQPGYLIWHMDAQYIPALKEYWALYAAFRPSDTCSATSLFFARSPDGIKWQTYPAPVLARDVVPYFSQNVYRSTFFYDVATDEVTFWFSGARAISVTLEDGVTSTATHWSAAIGHASRRSLFLRLAEREPTRPNPLPATPVRPVLMPDAP
jgi:hypothetical protein